jgi:hypothetical protein
MRHPKAPPVISLLATLCLLASGFPAVAIVPEYTVSDSTVRLKGVGPGNRILYDNDWWFDEFDNNYLR